MALRAFLCCYVSSMLSFMFLRKKEGRNHHVHNRVFSGSVKRDIDSESSEFL